MSEFLRIENDAKQHHRPNGYIVAPVLHNDGKCADLKWNDEGFVEKDWANVSQSLRVENRAVNLQFHPAMKPQASSTN